MSDSEAYKAGLEKLHLWSASELKQWYNGPNVIDLRKDPAFAWRVLEALHALSTPTSLRALGGFTMNLKTIRLGGSNKLGPSDWLHAAVCELGRE